MICGSWCQRTLTGCSTRHNWIEGSIPAVRQTQVERSGLAMLLLEQGPHSTLHVNLHGPAAADQNAPRPRLFFHWVDLELEIHQARPKADPWWRRSSQTSFTGILSTNGPRDQTCVLAADAALGRASDPLERQARPPMTELEGQLDATGHF